MRPVGLGVCVVLQIQDGFMIHNMCVQICKLDYWVANELKGVIVLKSYHPH